MSSERPEKLGNTGIYYTDLVRVARLKQPRTVTKKRQRILEQNADVLRRALDALEEKEKKEQ